MTGETKQDFLPIIMTCNDCGEAQKEKEYGNEDDGGWHCDDCRVRCSYCGKWVVREKAFTGADGFLYCDAVCAFKDEGP